MQRYLGGQSVARLLYSLHLEQIKSKHIVDEALLRVMLKGFERALVTLFDSTRPNLLDRSRNERVGRGRRVLARAQAERGDMTLENL
jgi:hypothetical protein